jgi:hypothetical protein
VQNPLVRGPQAHLGQETEIWITPPPAEKVASIPAADGRPS